MKFKVIMITLMIFLSLSSNIEVFSQEMGKILCFGNSLTAGYGLSKEKSWPMIVQEKLNSEGNNYKIIQSGLSGETSAGGLSRIKWVLKEPVDIFILELGPNDGLRGLPVKHTQENLQAIIDYVKSKNPKVKVLIAGMRVPPNMGPEYSEEFKTMFDNLAEKTNSNLIPFFLTGVAGQRDLNLSDGIHPNEKGQKIVAETVWENLKPLL